MLGDLAKTWLYPAGVEAEPLQRGMQGHGGDASQRLMAALHRIAPAAEVPTPRVVVMGSQSSGKSTLINALVGLPLLPTSDGEMCTRVPLFLHMSSLGDPVDNNNNNAAGEVTLSIGERCVQKWQLDVGNWRGDGDEGLQIRAAIRAASDELVAQEGGGAAPAAEQQRLHLSLRLPHCPEMSLVDLPGLTACDRSDVHGRAASAGRLRRIAAEMGSLPETVIVAVMAARADIEVDLSWQVLKQIDAEGERTAIVLTKPDLTNPCAAFRRVLANDGGGNIAAKLGYHVVMLKSFFDDEGGGGAHGNGRREARFFDEHQYAPLRREMPSRFGVAEVRRRLRDVGRRNVAKHLPRITDTLIEHRAAIEERLRDLGDPGEPALANPVAWVAGAVRGAMALLRESLRGRNSQHVAVGGTPIAASLARLRGGIASLRPLDRDDQCLAGEAVEGSTHRGIHLPEVSLVALLENRMQASSTGSHMALVETCLGEISRAVIEASDYACGKAFSPHRSALSERVRGIVAERCAAASARCRGEAFELLEAEVGHVWCATPEFEAAFARGSQGAAVEAYQADLVAHTSHYIPRLLLHGMTTRLLDNLEVALVDGILSPEVLADQALLERLVGEDSGVAEARQEAKSQLVAAQRAIAMASRAAGE